MIFLLAFALLALCGCGTREPNAAADDLTPVLEGISAEVHPGTAGSSLRAAQQACALMDWCCETEMAGPDIRAAVESFLAARSAEDQQLFSTQLDAVVNAADYLMREDGTGLLEDIGGPEGTLWPWENAPREKLDAILDAAAGF